MKDMHTENYKTLMNLVEEDTNKWKNIWIGRSTIVKMFIPSKVIYRCKILMTLLSNFTDTFNRNRKSNPKICLEP